MYALWIMIIGISPHSNKMVPLLLVFQCIVVTETTRQYRNHSLRELGTILWLGSSGCCASYQNSSVIWWRRHVICLQFWLCTWGMSLLQCCWWPYYITRSICLCVRKNKTPPTCCSESQAANLQDYMHSYAYMGAIKLYKTWWSTWREG
jgi:hypothetical protein